MSISRRQLLSGASIAGVGLVAGPGVAAAAARQSRALTELDDGCGHLPDRLFEPFPPLAATPGSLIALPPGFSYQEVAVSGQTDIHDGGGTLIGKTPERPDGTLAVREGGHAWRLIQNHEGSPGSLQPVPLVPGTVYDPGALAGGSTIIETTTSGERVSEWVGLSGTISNCAGGPTPWGSWLSCEETEDKAGTGTLEKDHGYVYEVFATTPDQQLPEPIRAWGRFSHEAVVIEPTRGRAYLTEDVNAPRGLFYRWTAPDGVRLRPYIAAQLGPDDGVLEAMAVQDTDGDGVLPDLSYVTAAQLGRPFRTSWVTVPDRHATTASVRNQFDETAITRSRKLEGAWGDQHGVYFVASFANSSADLPPDATWHDGQLWYYSYRDETLTLVGYCPYSALLHSTNLNAGWEARLGRSIDLAFDGLDGCHVSPYGPLILTEDGDSANHVLSWSREVGFQSIARNQVVLRVNARGGNVYSEMTGPAFSPDGNVLFSNIFNPGHVLAITGPWSRYLR